MNKCDNCKIIIHDDTNLCPLCKSELFEDTKYKPDEPKNPRSEMYPYNPSKIRKLELAMSILIVSSIATGLICILINFLTYWDVKWSFIVCAVLAYSCVVSVYTSKRVVGHRTKMINVTIFTAVLSVVVDNIIGYIGWSVNIFIPCGFMVMGVVILIMMAAVSSWQNYIYMLIALAVISLLYLLFIPLGIVTFEIISVIAAAILVATVVVVIVIGNKAASTEISRRFHI